ncbi:hypothetical protein RM652_12450 [Mammaliicoccus sciuri]|uniref:hypothetical protein n=1 Tax=Mammaliicoccus sciuri TaxID=1296 RepID=UPI002883889C|nr:hypothetical protein [Mammaliicoccus sciuri]MDT0703933.1 hypothetical protein [Mammaliicoccus sciuri]
MPTIKTKKEMNLPELIEWAAKNKVANQIFRADKQLMNIQFDNHGDFKTYGFTSIDTTFTVETEEPITEDTVLDAVVIVRRQISPYGGESTHVCRKGNVSINQVLSLQPNNSQFVYLEIHLMKNDRIDQLIWTKEKGLVE